MSDTLKQCKDCGDVTPNGVAFEWWLVNINGAGFELLREPHHTDKDIEEAKACLLRDRDVVGRIRVRQLTEGDESEQSATGPNAGQDKKDGELPT